VPDWLAVLIVAALILVVVAWIRRMRGASGTPDGSGGRPTVGGSQTGDSDGKAGEADGKPGDPGGSTEGESADPLALAAPLVDHFEATAHPRDLLLHEQFASAAESLRRSERTNRELIAYANGANDVVACMALEALAGRTDEDLTEQLLDCLNIPGWWIRYFALRALDAHAREPVIGRALARLDRQWQPPLPAGMLRDFVHKRMRDGESVLFTEDPPDAESMERMGRLVASVADGPAAGLADAYELWRAAWLDASYYSSIGQLWRPGTADPVSIGGADPEAVELRDSAGLIGGITSAIGSRRSVVVTGGHGAGKSTALGFVARQLLASGWYVWVASGNDLLAGQMYRGQLEERIQRIVRDLRGRQVVWIVPDLHEFLYAGRHSENPMGFLETVMPFIESGELVLLGEADDQALLALHREVPRLKNAVDSTRVETATEAETLALARDWAVGRAGSEPAVSEPVLQEAWQLAQQYLGERVAPGNLMELLRRTWDRRTAGGTPPGPLTQDDLLGTLVGLTGLPRSILDDREELSLPGLRQFFDGRVLGQPEAVESLIERVAMIKAGLTDPTRPQGVFLFVGPTGTGKTEIAKALAEYLFGAADRMIRLDMSELQTSDSLDRLLGSTNPRLGVDSLIQQIRKQPFSLVLLDEFEKAHPNVWDLFLQLFDDGRLTDRMGRTADFRHAIVIMTSNLGAAVGTGRAPGFTGSQRVTSTVDVEKALKDTFRPEFLNRIDRIVPFRPLSRETMRKLLDKELEDLLGRRGLRNREVAIEWDDSGVEFLLEKGFTAEYGARPLKRAVERHLLTPLAVAIVEREFPEGDAFLFLRAENDRLVVEWVDPDAFADMEDAEPEEPGAAGLDEPLLEAIALDGRGVRPEVESLEAEYEHLRGIIEGEVWQEAKEGALKAMSQPGFWDSPDRFTTLGEAESRDRIEVGFETAGSLLRRVGGGDRQRFSPPLVRRLAERLYLLGVAVDDLAQRRPQEAFLRVRARHDPGSDTELEDAFARRIARMYSRWSDKRGMRRTLLDERGAGEAGPYEITWAIDGFGAHTILAPEMGLHVLEVPHGDRFRRARALVLLASQGPSPAGVGTTGLLKEAQSRFRELDGGAAQTVVRRYREEPSPLVRDGVRDWRTGRLDAVLDGDFDLIC
jgi:ATP-dependent Clp protease ATP-binding subunit ClpC